MASSCQKEKNAYNKIKNLKRKVYQILLKKYQQLSKKYNSNIIDNIIYNERSHIVALFKDRLIQDDNGEFLKRYYLLNEAIIRLPKFFEYYSLYSKIFPNYTSLEEGKYFYQNIQKKQKMIDIQEQKDIEKIEKAKSKKIIIEDISINNNKNKDNKEKDYVFSTDIINSILNGTNKESVEILFNINKEKINEEEVIFYDKINNLIQTISKLENDRNKNKNYYKIKNSESNSENRKKEIINNSGKKNKIINNTLLENDLHNKNVKINNFIKTKIRKNTIFNLNDKNMNNSINIKNININKLNKGEKNFIKKIEYNIFKKKKLISENHAKNRLHDISTSIKKELSKSKKNSSNNSKMPSNSTSSFNILINNISYNHKIKIHNKINPKLKKFKNSLMSPNPLTSRIINKTGRINFSLDKKQINNNKKNKTKYNKSSNNIYKIIKHKKSLSNEKRSKKYKQNILNQINNFRKNNINNNINVQKNINIKIKERNKRKSIKYIYNTKNIYNKINTYYLIDSRNYIFNEFLNIKRKKTNSIKKKSVNSKSSSKYNSSKSRSKSNHKNNSKNNLMDSNNSNLFKKNIRTNINNKNLNINWKIDSRNKRALFLSKNTSKLKTKNIVQNNSYLKASFLGSNNYIKYSNKIKDIKNYSKLFKYIGNKNYSTKSQRNYSFNNIFSF